MELQSVKCNRVCACMCTHMHQVLCQRLGAEGLTEEDVVSPWLELSFCHCLRKVLSWWSFLLVNFHYYSMNGSSFLEWLILMRSAGIPSTYNHTAWMECYFSPDCNLVQEAAAAAAAAAAKSLQLWLTLCDPIDGSPPGSSIPGSLQARTLEWVAISFSNTWKWKVKVKSLSCVQVLVTPWTAAYQAPPSMKFSRQECWSGVPLPSLRSRGALQNPSEL